MFVCFLFPFACFPNHRSSISLQFKWIISAILSFLISKHNRAIWSQNVYLMKVLIQIPFYSSPLTISTTRLGCWDHPTGLVGNSVAPFRCASSPGHTPGRKGLGSVPTNGGDSPDRDPTWPPIDIASATHTPLAAGCFARPIGVESVGLKIADIFLFYPIFFA